MLNVAVFEKSFYTLTNGWTWEVEGFVDKSDNVYPIDTDTKVISTVFERLSSPVVRSIADRHGYIVENANQTTYPDFTLTNRDMHRIAIDIKTTYRSGNMMFTLGGYNSFIRNDTKNILHPYSTYNEHWILGFIYDQKPSFPEYSLQNLPRRGEIPCPYDNVVIFIREKYAISGLSAGSGNTKNIGSIKRKNPSEFQTVQGPFTNFINGKAACDHYWKNYERYRPVISDEKALLSHPDFQQFRPR